MSRPSALALAASLVVLALLGSACSDDGGGDDSAATTIASADETTTTATEDEDGSDPGEGEGGNPDEAEAADDAADSDEATEAERSDDFPCDLIDVAEVEAVVGDEVVVDGPRRTTNTRNEDEWSSLKCSWVSDVPEQEIVLDVGRADGFASGEVECVESAYGSVEIEAPAGADSAYWTWDGVRVMAELEVCAPDALLELTADTWDDGDEAGAQAALLGLAETALAALGDG